MQTRQNHDPQSGYVTSSKVVASPGHCLMVLCCLVGWMVITFGMLQLESTFKLLQFCPLFLCTSPLARVAENRNVCFCLTDTQYLVKILEMTGFKQTIRFIKDKNVQTFQNGCQRSIPISNIILDKFLQDVLEWQSVLVEHATRVSPVSPWPSLQPQPGWFFETWCTLGVPGVVPDL